VKLNLRTEVPQWLLIAGMFVASAIVWRTSPDQIPVHWNAAGEVDRYGGKAEGLLMLPLITIGLYLLLLFLPRIDPRKANYALFTGSYAVIRISLVVLMTAIHALVILWIEDIKINAAVVVLGGVGLLFIVLGLVMGKVQPNWFVGIRTPWTLASRRSWVKTHRLGGWMFIGMGLVTMLSAAMPGAWGMAIMMTVIFGSVAILVVYSYIEWRNDPDRQSHDAPSHG
jgi:uncharacterized membrane protein